MSKHGKTSMHGSLGAGSEEYFDVICDPCNTEGQHVQATGHCIDCNENMCISCIKFHKKLAAVKDHVVKDKSTLTQSQKARNKDNMSVEYKDPMTDRCPKHPDELIKFYCNSHCKLGCTDCISLDHRSCKDILYIKEVSGGVANSDELTKIQTDIQMLVARLTSIQTRIKSTKKAVNDSYYQTVFDIKNLRSAINGMLDLFEKEVLERASRMKKERLEALDRTVSASGSAIGETETIYADIEKKKVKGHNNQLFISMKNSQSQILDIADKADQLCNKSNCEHFAFQPDKQLNNLLSTLTSLGEVLLVSQTRDVKAEKQYEINANSAKDTTDSLISDIIVLPDGLLALVDAENISIKLLDVKQRTLVDQIKLESSAIALASTGSTELAATLVNKRYIQVFSVSPALSKSYTITTSCTYYGIEYIPNKLILVCRDPTSAVHICDMSGAVLQQIEMDYSGNRLFTQASRIAVSRDNDMMYVTDASQHTVVCLTMDGKLISKYTSDNLNFPVGIAVDDNGCAYVCSRDNHAVHQLFPSGKLVNVLRGGNGFLFPFAIAYRTGYLYISNDTNKPEYSRCIKTYRLTEK